MRILLDEMYPPSLAGALGEAKIDAIAVRDAALGGSSDDEVFAAAISRGEVLLTENVADFAVIAANHLGAGGHHPGLLIALSSRFSRRPSGRAPLVAAVRAISCEPLVDRTVYLTRVAR